MFAAALVPPVYLSVLDFVPRSSGKTRLQVPRSASTIAIGILQSWGDRTLSYLHPTNSLDKDQRAERLLKASRLVLPFGFHARHFHPSIEY